VKKGVVVKQKKRCTIVMEEDGTFHKAKPISYGGLGMEVFYKPKEETRDMRFFLKDRFPKTVAMVMAILLIVFPLYGWYDNNEAYAYVNIDMNPSVELKVDEDMKVIDIAPLNDDGKTLVAKLSDWEDKSVQQVTVSIIDKSKEEGFITSENNVLIGVSYIKDPGENQHLTEVIDKYLDQYVNEYQIATFEIPSDIREKAKKENRSMNEIMATELNEETNTKVAVTKSSIDKQEEVIIQSFYKQPNHPKHREKIKEKKEHGKQIGKEKNDPNNDRSKEKNKKKDEIDNKHKNHKDNKENKHKKDKEKNKEKDKKDKKNKKNDVSNLYQENEQDSQKSESLTIQLGPILHQLRIE
jgi:hypothetical protein